MPGPFYFALADFDETTFGVEHLRWDYSILSFDLEHAEGRAAILSVRVPNPRVGLLAPGQKLYAWLAWDKGNSDIEPLFFGRLVGIPSDMLGESVTLEYIATPVDMVAQKQALAATLKVRPYWDPVFIDEAFRDDPDAVLEGYSALWHFDRVTHAVTKSDLLIGEDGVEVFDEGDVFYRSVKISLEQTPLKSVTVDADLHWTQSAAGTIDLGTRIIGSLTGDGVLTDWPKVGASLGAGWSAGSGTSVHDQNVVGTRGTISFTASYQNRAEKHRDGDTMSVQESFSGPIGTGPFSGIDTSFSGENVIGDPNTGTPASFKLQRTGVMYPRWAILTTLVLQYDSARNRTEHVNFTLTADLQPILTAPEDDSESEIITVNGSDVGVALFAGTSDAELPIGNAARYAYLPTARGLWSLEYLICLGRAHLLHRARAVKVSWECRFERAIELSCRKNAQITDPRLPGGVALGKIVSYGMSGDGNSGKMIGRVTIGCAIGYGNSVAAAPGTPTYAEEGYMEPGYQYYADTVVALPASDVGYSIPVAIPNDDGLVFPLTYGQVVVREEMVGDVAAQEAAVVTAVGNPLHPQLTVGAFMHDQAAGARNALAALRAAKLWYELELKPVTGQSFESEYNITITDLKVPKQIDLEAAS